MTISDAPTKLRSWTLTFNGRPPRSNHETQMPYGVSPEKLKKIVLARRGEQQRWKKLAHMTVRMHDIPKLPRIRISAVFFRRNMNSADYDGDVFAMKRILDGIVAAGVVPNDSRRYVEWGDVLEERGRPYRVELTLEELEAI